MPNQIPKNLITSISYEQGYIILKLSEPILYNNYRTSEVKFKGDYEKYVNWACSLYKY